MGEINLNRELSIEEEKENFKKNLHMKVNEVVSALEVKGLRVIKLNEDKFDVYNNEEEVAGVTLEKKLSDVQFENGNRINFTLSFNVDTESEAFFKLIAGIIESAGDGTIH